MNTLSHYIECLLLHHDCVVVPQFGAFITMDNESSRVESEDLFFPPLRVVRFHPDLTEDDGLLVESMRVAMHQSAIESKRKIQLMVLELRQQLLADGQVDFGSLGLFSQDEDGHVTFEPCQAGAITPAYFGLDAFVMPRLSALQRRSLDVARKERVAEQEDEGHITIRLNRRKLRYVAATVAAVLVGLLFSSPVTETMNQPQQATIMPSDAPKTVVTQPVEAMPAETNLAEATAVETKLVEAEPVVAPVPTVTPQISEAQPHKEVVAEPIREVSGYCIVLASDVSKKNADNFAIKLKSLGFEQVRVVEKGKYRRVVIGNFATLQEAADRNAEIHRRGGEFAASWVLKL